MTAIAAAAGTGGVTRARRWAWLPTLVVGIALFELVRHALIDTENPNLVPTLILIGAAVVPATFVAFLAGRRFAHDIPGWLLAVTALVGGVIGVVLAGIWEYHTLITLGTTSMAAVGLAEETAKLIFPALVLPFVKHRRPANGLLLGVASGAGFAALETMGYAFVTLIQSGGSLAAVDGLLLLRGLLSPAGHMAWTGVTAAALWYAAARRWQAAAVLRFVTAFLVAVGLHAAWDSSGSTPGFVTVAVISFGLLVLTTIRISREDRATVAARRPAGPSVDR
ncbi:MAG: hypothetical protein JWP40_1108 [Blastococcus sp.]|nr:hypothetical protein [Blastococcus sp.]